MEFIVLFLVVLMIVIFFINTKKSETVSNPSKNSASLDIEHTKREYLATANERKFYAALKGVLKDQYQIHCQVSLIALVVPVEFKHKKRAYSRRMDYVVTDNQTKIICVIELDDSTHNSKKRQKSDEYINSALEGHYPLLRFQTKKFYEQGVVAKRLNDEAGVLVESENVL